jgi:MFS family permease
MGMWMDQTSRTWLIYKLTGSPLQLGLISAARGLPLLLFGVLAGVIADRYGRKFQLIIAQMVNAALNISLATLVLTGHIQVWHVYLTGFLNGTVQAFQQPARQALINDLVGEKYLLNAISLNSAAVNLSRSLGPGICGLLITAFGVDVTYYIQAGMYLFATLWTVQIVAPDIVTRVAETTAEIPQSFWNSAAEGIRYILKNRLILALMILGLAPILLGMPFMSLMPVFAQGNASHQGFMLSALGVGAVLGALTIASIGHRQGSGKLMIVGAAGFGVSLILFSHAPTILLAVGCTFLSGLSNSAYTSQDQTIIQMLAPKELRGRILGVYFLNRGLMPLGSLLAGGLATLLTASNAVLVMGSLCFLLAVGVAFFVRDIWRLNLVPANVASKEPEAE